jgi:hypothetical protein
LYLQEIPETASTGSVAEVYEGLRRTLGVPFVAFVYRALAVEPGRLERIWADLLPNMTSAYMREAADELAVVTRYRDVNPVPVVALAVSGFDVGRVAATLDGFRRVNSANLLVVHALLEGVDGRVAPAERAIDEAGTPEPMLPIPEMASFPEEVRALLDEMSISFAGDERPALIPSLLRALATYPCLLALIWATLRPLVEHGEFRSAAGRVSDRAASLARELPYRVTRVDDEGAREVLRRFAPAIPAMLVGGELMEGALAEALGRPA